MMKMNNEKVTYSDITGAVTGRGEDDLDDAADMSDPPATEALRDPPDSDKDQRLGEMAIKSSQGKMQMQTIRFISLEGIISVISL